jgi:hypothetical protein
MSIDEWMTDFIPLIIIVALLALSFVVMDYFEMDTDKFTLVLFFYGLLSVGVVLFGFREPLVLLFGVVAIGISLYVEFVRGG